MSIDHSSTRRAELFAALAGGGVGFIVGTLMGGLAVFAAAIEPATGWIVALHAGFALMLMGAWTAPCLVPDGEPERDEEAIAAGSIPVVHSTNSLDSQHG